MHLFIFKHFQLFFQALTSIFHVSLNHFLLIITLTDWVLNAESFIQLENI